MNIYLAASWPRRNEMRGYAAQLRELGHTVVSRWHEGLAEHPSDEELLGEDQTLAIRLASEDWDDLEASELVIGFTERPSLSRGGRSTEYGLALAMETPCWIVGAREQIYHALADRVFPAWEAALAALSPQATRRGEEQESGT